MILVDQIIIKTQIQMTTVVMVGISMAEINQERAAVVIDHLAIGVKIMVILVEIKGIEVELGLTPAQMAEDQE